MALRPYLRPEYLSRIPIDGLPIEELGDVIGKVAVALHQLAESVEIGLDVVDLVIRDVLEQHRRERSAPVEADGPVALLPVPEGGEGHPVCTCEGGDIGLPHVSDCPLYLTATAPAQWLLPQNDAEDDSQDDPPAEGQEARILVLRPQDPDASGDG